jgi:hypothetical protein
MELLLVRGQVIAHDPDVVPLTLRPPPGARTDPGHHIAKLPHVDLGPILRLLQQMLSAWIETGRLGFLPLGTTVPAPSGVPDTMGSGRSRSEPLRSECQSVSRFRYGTIILLPNSVTAILVGPCGSPSVEESSAPTAETTWVVKRCQ